MSVSLVVGTMSGVDFLGDTVPLNGVAVSLGLEAGHMSKVSAVTLE